MDQLRATFIVGPRTDISAQDAFTNRVNEFVAFEKSIANLKAGIDSSVNDLASLDLNAGRTNVLCYYGIGGIGKTALSRELESRFIDRTALPNLDSDRSTCRIDFGEGGGFDLEAMLLQIRSALAAFSPKWPAFDFAFSLYWAAAHPGESLPSYIQASSRLAKRANQVGLAEQIQDTVITVFQELGMSWAPTRMAMKVATLTKDKLAKSIRYGKLKNDCPFFESVVTADDPERALSYMSSLLGWQFDKIKCEENVELVVFLDTFEAIQARPNRDLERLLQHVVFLMPSVLFVITSRHRLDWGDELRDGELDYVGRARWPLLHQGVDPASEPRQHLVGRCLMKIATSIC